MLLCYIRLRCGVGEYLLTFRFVSFFPSVLNLSVTLKYCLV